jgi:hypothetical protein
LPFLDIVKDPHLVLGILEKLDPKQVGILWMLLASTCDADHLFDSVWDTERSEWVGQDIIFAHLGSAIHTTLGPDGLLPFTLAKYLCILIHRRVQRESIMVSNPYERELHEGQRVREIFMNVPLLESSLATFAGASILGIFARYVPPTTLSFVSSIDDWLNMSELRPAPSIIVHSQLTILYAKIFRQLQEVFVSEEACSLLLSKFSATVNQIEAFFRFKNDFLAFFLTASTKLEVSMTVILTIQNTWPTKPFFAHALYMLFDTFVASTSDANQILADFSALRQTLPAATVCWRFLGFLLISHSMMQGSDKNALMLHSALFLRWILSTPRTALPTILGNEALLCEYLLAYHCINGQVSVPTTLQRRIRQVLLDRPWRKMFYEVPQDMFFLLDSVCSVFASLLDGPCLFSPSCTAGCGTKRSG